MPLQKPLERIAPQDELEHLRLTLARRLAAYWSHDAADDVLEEVRAWLVEASDQRAAALAVNRRHAERFRAARTREKRKYRQEAPVVVMAELDPEQFAQAVSRLASRGVVAHALLAAAICRSFGEADIAETQQLVSKARRLLRRIVKKVRYEDTAEIAFVLGEGKANAPQSIATLALAELGWSTARIAAALPANGRANGKVDRAQVRRMTRPAR